MTFKTQVQEQQKEIISTTQRLIQFNTVESQALPNAPFGQGNRDALDYVLDLGRKWGFAVKDLDGYAGYLEFGDGREVVAVIPHLDVVPEGDGWDYPPFGGELSDGRIFGRGAADNKGPAVAALYAFKFVRDSGLPVNKRVRLIFGCDEESGVAAHASTPEIGDNAIIKLARQLQTLYSHPVLEFLNAAADRDTLGIAAADEIIGKLKATGKKYGFSFENYADSSAHYVPEDSALVKTLLQVYRETTGLGGKPLAMGGGTYARVLGNFVAFGARFPGESSTAHQRNEFITVDTLLKATGIYANAIFQLAKK